MAVVQVVGPEKTRLRKRRIFMAAIKIILNMDNDNHDKIALSNQDLSWVYGQVLSSTTAKLDLHLPTSNSDPLKRRVAGMLEEFVQELFEMVKNAMVVDGEDLGRSLGPVADHIAYKPREKTEPFDFELNGELRNVLELVEKETIKVSTLRKDVPAKVKQAYQQLIESTDLLVSRILAELDVEEEAIMLEENDVLPDLEGVVGDYEAAILALSKLNQSVPEQRAELAKLDSTMSYLRARYQAT